MKHAIIGTGNLGLDIALTLEKANHEVIFLDKAKGPDSYDVIWCTAGAGGPSPSLDVYLHQIETHIQLAQGLVEGVPPETRIVLFSTHYLNNDAEGWHSRYAHTKAIMEELSERHPNVVVFRVGSLYGKWFKHKTFPGKIISKLYAREPMTIPTNLITPTSTEWLAENIAENILDFKPGIYSIGPSGKITVAQWARMIANTIGCDPELITDGEPDPNYPEDSSRYGINAWAFKGIRQSVFEVWEKYGAIFKQSGKESKTLSVDPARSRRK